MEVHYVNPEHNKPDDPDAPPSADKKFLKFEQLTMIPIQQNLIDISMLTVREMDWLDSYHAKVYKKISPLLEPGSPALLWLQKSTTKINRTP
jgi:Xaa-Pro aminopeptidase